MECDDCKVEMVKMRSTFGSIYKCPNCWKKTHVTGGK